MTSENITNNDAGTTSTLRSGFLEEGMIIDDRYRIISRLGSGGFATVYKVFHLKIERNIALKVLEMKAGIADESFIERFKREGKIAAKIQHQNVVMIYDFGTIPETGQPYIAMELLEGHDLEYELEHNGPLSPHRAFLLFRPVLDALGEGHRLGIVHKDLKPGNLYMMDPGGPREHMKILDFGVARADEFSQLTNAGQLMGTPRYLAPEYIKQQLAIPAVDVYQMALIISEALTGKPAVEGNGYEAIMLHCNGEIEIADFLKQGPVGEVFKKAYAVDYTQRYQNCTEFAEALDTVADYFSSDVPLTGGAPQPVPTLTGMAPVTHHVPQLSGKTEQPAPEPEQKKKHPIILTVLITVAVMFFAFIALILIVPVDEEPEEPEPPELTEEELAEQKAAEEEAKAHEALMAMSPEDREWEMIRQLGFPEMPADTIEQRNLWNQLHGGDDEAGEKLGFFYLEREPHLRGNYEQAYKALSAVNIIMNPKASYELGQLKFRQLAPVAIKDPEKIKEAKKDIYRAAQMSYQPALDDIFSNIEEYKGIDGIDLNALYNIQNKIYTDMEKSGDKDALYYQANLLKADPDHKLFKIKKRPDYQELYQKAAEAGSEKARYLLAIDNICTDTDNSLNTLSELAQNKNPEASTWLAIHDIEAILNKENMSINPQTLLGLDCKEDLLSALRLQFDNLPNKQATLIEYIKNSPDIIAKQPNAIRKYYEFTKDDGVYEAFTDRLRNYMEKEDYSRESCDLISGILDTEFGARSAQIAENFSQEQLKTFSDIIETCYLNALQRGNDYPYDKGNATPSTSLILAKFYKGSDSWNMPPDISKRIGVLAHGSLIVKDGDAEYKLSKIYSEGEIWISDKERSCYWARKIQESDFAKYCQTEEGKEYSECFDITKAKKLLKNCE